MIVEVIKVIVYWHVCIKCNVCGGHVVGLARRGRKVPSFVMQGIGRRDPIARDLRRGSVRPLLVVKVCAGAYCKWPCVARLLV